MHQPTVIERRCEVAAGAEDVWARVTTAVGIRHELAPVLGMTMPPGLRGADLSDPTLVGRPLGRAWVLLGGVVPVEYDDMTLVELGQSWFHERSRTMTLQTWAHRREVAPIAPGRCAVTDRLTIVPRLSGAPGRVVGAIATRVVGALFSHRQRRLQRWANGTTTEPRDAR